MNKDTIIEIERLLLRQWRMEDVDAVVDEVVTGLLKDEWIK